MFCSKCGTKAQNESSQFCASCGNALAQAAQTKKPKAAKAAPIEAEAAPASVPSQTPGAGKTPGGDKKRLLMIGGGVIAVILAAVVGFGLLGGNPVNKDNAEEFMVPGDLVSSSTKTLASDDVDFEGELLSECNVKTELEGLFTEGTTWVNGGFSSKDGADDAFHVHQRIYTADAKILEDTTSLLEEAGTDSSCDSASSGSGITYSFDYSNPRSIQDEFDVNLKGTIIDLDTTICWDGCFTTKANLMIAYRDNVAMLFKYSGGTDGAITYTDVRDAVATTIEKFGK